MISVIAELAWGHQGSLHNAKKLVDSSANAGADFVGIHFTDLPSYMTPYYAANPGTVSSGREVSNLFSYLESISLSPSEELELVGHARVKGLKIAAMPNDYESLYRVRREIDPDAYVVAAAVFDDIEFVETIFREKKTTFLRVGGATLEEIKRLVRLASDIEHPGIVLLHGVQNYPTEVSDLNLAALNTLRDFGADIGLADHIAGHLEEARILPILALAYGVKYVEKHITLDRELQLEDHEAALEPDDFKRFVGLLRTAEKAIGQDLWEDETPSVKRYRVVSRKRVVAARDLASGTLLAENDLMTMRADNGAQLSEKQSLVGRKLIKGLRKFDGVESDNTQ